MVGLVIPIPPCSLSRMPWRQCNSTSTAGAREGQQRRRSREGSASGFSAGALFQDRVQDCMRAVCRGAASGLCRGERWGWVQGRCLGAVCRITNETNMAMAAVINCASAMHQQQTTILQPAAFHPASPFFQSTGPLIQSAAFCSPFFFPIYRSASAMIRATGGGSFSRRSAGGSDGGGTPSNPDEGAWRRQQRASWIGSSKVRFVAVADASNISVFHTHARKYMHTHISECACAGFCIAADGRIASGRTQQVAAAAGSPARDGSHREGRGGTGLAGTRLVCGALPAKFKHL
eukprot:765768-Pelagomonas_calceolata.AAC.9